MTRVIRSAAHATDAEVAKILFQVQHRSGAHSHWIRESSVSRVPAAHRAQQATGDGTMSWRGLSVNRLARLRRRPAASGLWYPS